MRVCRNEFSMVHPKFRVAGGGRVSIKNFLRGCRGADRKKLEARVGRRLKDVSPWEQGAPTRRPTKLLAHFHFFVRETRMFC